MGTQHSWNLCHSDKFSIEDESSINNIKTYNMGNLFWEQNTHSWNSDQTEISAWWSFAEEKQNLGLNERRRELTDYQKAVKLKNLDVVAMEAIDPAAKVNCVILRTSARTEPGAPQ